MLFNSDCNANLNATSANSHNEKAVTRQLSGEYNIYSLYNTQTKFNVI